MSVVLEIERRSIRAVPPVEATDIEGWHVPFGRGQVRRMNAVTTFGVVPSESLETVERVERRYRNRSRPAWFRMTDLDGEVDDLLYARGYDRSAPTSVMAAPAGGEMDPAVSVLPAATPGWLDDLARLGEYSALRIAEIGEGLAGLTLTHGAFRIANDAVGLAVVDGDWVGLFDIAVDPTKRRRGLGRRITRAMLAWGEEHGAGWAYLQVMEDNSPAVDLYRGLGFAQTHRYWYRTKT